MLLNLSNHPLSNWSEEQKRIAEALFGEIVDMPFPQVAPDGDEAYIDRLAREYFDRIANRDDVDFVHIMGEMNFTFALVSKLRAVGIRCFASTTERETVEENGVKISEFNFVRFREYM